ncbi:MAG: hypothetical protein NZZ41_01805 [Candidatus Dojkabacteria bacterium]|nr:hypothetical protein [Candidatus Dojkabacteria bacterium]
MLKVVFYFLIVISCVLVSVYSPWIYITFDLTNLFGIEKPEDISGLKVVTITGDIEVYVDNQRIGQVKQDDKRFTFDRIKTGLRLVKLKRISSNESNIYWEFNKLINFEKGVYVVIFVNLGPTKDFSEGHVIYPVRKKDINDPTYLHVIFENVGGIVQINNEKPVLLENKKEYKTAISLEQQNKVYVEMIGSESQEFTVLPDSQEDRDKFKGYDIYVEVFMFNQPIQVNLK